MSKNGAIKLMKSVLPGKCNEVGTAYFKRNICSVQFVLYFNKREIFGFLSFGKSFHFKVRSISRRTTFKEKDVIGDSVKDFTEVQIKYICSPSLVQKWNHFIPEGPWVGQAGLVSPPSPPCALGECVP